MTDVFYSGFLLHVLAIKRIFNPRTYRVLCYIISELKIAFFLPCHISTLLNHTESCIAFSLPQRRQPPAEGIVHRGRADRLPDGGVRHGGQLGGDLQARLLGNLLDEVVDLVGRGGGGRGGAH